MLLILGPPAWGAETLTLPTDGSGLPKLHFRAGELSYQPDQRQIELREQVSLKAQGIELQAGQILVRLDGQGHPRLIEARGNIRMKVRGNQGRADRVEILARERRITLSGRVELRLEQLGLDLRGEKIQLDLASGRVTVHSARARWTARTTGER